MVNKEHRSLVILNGFVLDVESFIDEHPGGKKIMKAYIGMYDNNYIYMYIYIYE